MSKDAADRMEPSTPEHAIAEISGVVLIELYCELLSALDKLKTKWDSGEDDQTICIEAIRHVSNFLDVNPEVHKAGLTRPFKMLFAGFTDLRAGSPSKLFEVQKRPEGGRPPGKSRVTALRAVGAACFALLLDAGIAREEAAGFVLKKLNEAGYFKSGKGIIKIQTIFGWRDEMGGRIVGDDQNIYRQIVKHVKHVKHGLGEPLSKDKVRQQVQGIIAGMRDEGIPRD